MFISFIGNPYFEVSQKPQFARNPDTWKIVCAICGAYIRGDENSNNISHGYCATCGAVEKKKIESAKLFVKKRYDQINCDACSLTHDQKSKCDVKAKLDEMRKRPLRRYY